MEQCKFCKYESAAFMPCNACEKGSQFVPKDNLTLITFDKKTLFVKAASALVKSVSQTFKVNDFLYTYGIDTANYSDPAYTFLESFISNNYDDEYGNIMDCLFALAEFGVADVGDHDVTTVEEIYDFFFKEART